MGPRDTDSGDRERGVLLYCFGTLDSHRRIVEIPQFDHSEYSREAYPKEVSKFEHHRQLS